MILIANRVLLAAGLVDIRVPATSLVFAVTKDCTAHAWNSEPTIGKVQIDGTLNAAASSTTILRVYYGLRGDFDHDSAVDMDDIPVLVNILLGLDTDCVKFPIADCNGDGANDGRDIGPFTDALVP